MFIDDTIAAISTPSGCGGIGIVRLSGQDSLKIADRIFHSPKKKKIPQTPSHRILYGRIVNPATGEVIDEALVSVMKAPNTYTREDIVEINCHGGAVSIRRILELVLSEGARPARPGEFTQRAFMNGRIDLAQAEAVLDVINSLTVQGQKSAVQQLGGGLSVKIEAIREGIVELAAFVEAHIDFPEEEIDSISLQEMRKRAIGIRQSLEKLIESSQYGLILRDGLKTAIIGRPNVGKSSLLNALLQQERAIVTDIPGTTRDIIEDYLNIQGIPVKIMDTAGIRDVQDIAEKEGVRRSLKSIEDADLLLLLLDGASPLHNADRELIRKSGPKKTILVINKSDLPRKLQLSGLNGRSALHDRTICISAREGAGLERLKEMIAGTALEGQAESSTDMVTNIRHVHALEKTLTSINAFISELRNKTSPEFMSVELREALDAIGEIAGVTTPDEILNKIFSNFCIGK